MTCILDMEIEEITQTPVAIAIECAPTVALRIVRLLEDGVTPRLLEDELTERVLEGAPSP